MSETPSDTSETGSWLTKNDAARFYRCTYRQVDRKKLPKRRLPGRPVEVWVAGATSENVSIESETSDGPPNATPTLAMVPADRVLEMARQYASRIEELSRENGALSERLKASDNVSDHLRREVSALEETAMILAAEAARADALAADLARQAGRRWYDPRTW